VTLALVDTSAWSRRGQDDVAVVIAGAIEANAVAVIAPIILELLRSAPDSRELEELAEELDMLHRVELSRAIEDRAREVLVALAARGYHRGPSPTDLLAAAAAEAVGAELWHRDRHFELIAGVTGQPERRLGRS